MRQPFTNVLITAKTPYFPLGIARAHNVRIKQLTTHAGLGARDLPHSD